MSCEPNVAPVANWLAHTSRTCCRHTAFATVRPMPKREVQDFISHWSAASPSERANSQPFLIELCDLLDVPRPDPHPANGYFFEFPVEEHHPDGTTSIGRIDLYRRACFVLESKQFQEAKAKASQLELAAEETGLFSRKKSSQPVRGTEAWDEALIETVVHLTEWPTVVLGDFEPEYLALPEEVLVTVMRDHQKYFAVEDADGKLAPHFLAVLNIQVDAEGEAIIRHGNARVLRARFKDARFFWDFDQKTPLAERVESLKKVTFFRPPKGEPWSYYWKTEQNIVATRQLGAAVVLKGGTVNFGLAAIAAEFAKTDLTTELVKEFTELQGVIGGLYIRTQWHQEGYPEHGAAIADAIYSQYIPASMEDAIPATVEGQLFGLADRIQTIVSMFGIGQAPTGSKDPFALRRSANAIVKILAESDLPLTLRDVMESYTGEVRIDQNGIMTSRMRDIDSDQTLTAVSAFLLERLNFYLKDYKGFAYDVVSAVLAAGADDVRDAIARAEALSAARESADFAAISAAFKRIKNILRQAEEKHFALGSPKDVKLAPEAQQLADAAAALVPVVAKLRQQRAYGEALALIATLRPVVDAFFDKVMVLDNDPAIRGAHLDLIKEVLRNFSDIADFSEIVTG